MIVTAKRNFDVRKYKRELSRAMPVLIESEAEYDRTIEEIDRLMTKGISKGLSPEEDRILKLLSKLVEDYEKENYPIPEAPPNEILKHLMAVRGVRQKDLLSIFGSDGTASEVVNGKRGISKTQAKALAEYFDVSVELFI
jgi:HTH-type transcriptional regulator/antitoxin HigA